MKSIALSILILVVCLGIGSVLGNQAGGFVVGIILAIVFTKSNWKTKIKKSS